MKKTNRMAFATALALLGTATGALAVTTAGLTPSGFTIGGPGTATLAASATTPVYTDASGNVDACTTVANTGRAAVRLTVTGSGGAGQLDVAVGNTSALCRDQVTLVELTCLGAGTATCTAQWRVDRD